MRVREHFLSDFPTYEYGQDHLSMEITNELKRKFSLSITSVYRCY